MDPDGKRCAVIVADGTVVAALVPSDVFRRLAPDGEPAWPVGVALSWDLTTGDVRRVEPEIPDLAPLPGWTATFVPDLAPPGPQNRAERRAARRAERRSAPIFPAAQTGLASSPHAPAQTPMSEPDAVAYLCPATGAGA